MPGKPTELDNMNRLRVEAEREVARLREVLLLPDGEHDVYPLPVNADAAPTHGVEGRKP